jgi:carboxymethylenebutenolidase
MPALSEGAREDTIPRYDKEAATMAWRRTVDFFNQHLRD